VTRGISIPPLLRIRTGFFNWWADLPDKILNKASSKLDEAKLRDDVSLSMDLIPLMPFHKINRGRMNWRSTNYRESEDFFVTDEPTFKDLTKDMPKAKRKEIRKSKTLVVV